MIYVYVYNVFQILHIVQDHAKLYTKNSYAMQLSTKHMGASNGSTYIMMFDGSNKICYPSNELRHKPLVLLQLSFSASAYRNDIEHTFYVFWKE